jgi:hypothetical protein
MVESISLLLDSFLPPNRCAKAKFRAGKIVSQFEREQAVTMERGLYALPRLFLPTRNARPLNGSPMLNRHERARGAPSPQPRDCQDAQGWDP